MNDCPPVKVLLVDDLDENLIALEALLRQDGVELLTARSGLAALELLLAHDVGLALLDVQMPEMDGYELAELMRGTDRTRHVPIIFLTAGSHDAQRVFRGYEVGAVDFLFKPLDPVLLAHKVNTFVALQRQRLERDVLADRLREMLRLHEMFVAAISHDLRSPLSTIAMGASMLQTELSDPRSLRTLARMRSGAERMTSMLDQLFNLSRARLGGGIGIEPREMDLAALVEGVAEELRAGHPERSLRVSWAGGPLVGRWDEQRLAQVLANLVGNALRHGTGAEDVEIELRRLGDGVSFAVHNAGDVPEAVRPHLFDPFRRGAPPSRDSLGLGLYIVAQLVKAHGGTITFTSSAHEGTTFRVTLPWHSSAPVDFSSSSQ